MSWSEDVAAVYTTREYKHPEIVFPHQQPTFVLKVNAWISEETAHGNKFLVVYLQDVASFQTFGYYLFCIESLSQVYVEYLVRVFSVGHEVKETVDGLT